jgi:hypothetical protein
MRRINTESATIPVPQFYLTNEEIRYNDSPSNEDRNNNISIFRRRNWNILNSSDEEDTNNLPDLDSGSPRLFSPLDYSYVTPHTRLLNRNETRFGQFDHEGCTFIGRNHKEKYGKLTIATIKKLLKCKLINLTMINDLIFRKIVTLFFNNLESPYTSLKNFCAKNANYSQNHVKIKKIISCFPSFKAILKRINAPDFNEAKHKNEVYFIKICLDLQHRFYLDYDYPLYKNFIKKNLNVIIKYFEKVSQENLTYINERLSQQAFKRFNLTTHKTAEDYIKQSKKEKDDCMMLAGGLEIENFIN